MCSEQPAEQIRGEGFRYISRSSALAMRCWPLGVCCGVRDGKCRWARAANNLRSRAGEKGLTIVGEASEAAVQGV